MSYNRLKEYLLRDGYKNGLICQCIFMKIYGNDFVIIFVCVNDIKIIETPKELPKAAYYLKKV